MKKFVLLALISLATVVGFVSCAKKGTCDACGKENVTVKEKEAFGEKAYLCEDCAKIFDAGMKLLNQ